MFLCFYVFKQRGVTLLEFLIYTTIIVIVLLSVLGILNITTNIRARQTAKSEVNRNLNFVIERLNYLGFQAEAFGNCPNPSSTICSTTSTQVDFIINYPDIGMVTSSVLLQTGFLKSTKTPTSTAENLTTSQVTTLNQTSTIPFFQKIGNTVQMKIKIRYNDGGNPLYKYEVDGQTTISLRK